MHKIANKLKFYVVEFIYLASCLAVLRQDSTGGGHRTELKLEHKKSMLVPWDIINSST